MKLNYLLRRWNKTAICLVQIKRMAYTATILNKSKIYTLHIYVNLTRLHSRYARMLELMSVRIH